MVYCFLGIAIIADRFMVAIEVITSAEISKTVTLPNGEKTTVKILRWNETVANLTLMALEVARQKYCCDWRNRWVAW